MMAVEVDYSMLVSGAPARRISLAEQALRDKMLDRVGETAEFRIGKSRIRLGVDTAPVIRGEIESVSSYGFVVKGSYRSFISFKDLLCGDASEKKLERGKRMARAL